jgi:hypothetical protein
MVFGKTKTYSKNKRGEIILKYPTEHAKTEIVWKDVDGRMKFARLLSLRLEVLRLAKAVQEAHAAQERLYNALKKLYGLNELDMLFVERDIEKRLQLQDEEDQAVFDRELASDVKFAEAKKDIDAFGK